VSEFVILLGRDLIDETMESVAITTSSAQLSPNALQKLNSGRVAAATGEAWEKLRVLLNDIAGRGWEVAQSSVSGFKEYLEKTAGELEEEAQSFRDLLDEKMREAMDSLMDKALRTMRNRTIVGGDVYALTSFTVQNKLSYTASAEVSLTALCRFIAAGEIAVTGTYGLNIPTAIMPGGRGHS
jgi:hypothetical protein